MELILDTGGWLFALAGQPDYERAMRAASLLIVPGLVLAEVDYHLRRRRPAMRRILADLDSGLYTYEPPTPDDLQRAAQIDRKFASTDLGLVDASIVALAERLEISRLLTTDSDFAAVRMGQKWDRTLELVVALPAR